MSAVAVIAAELSLLVNGTELNCQLTSANLTWTDETAGTTIYTACPSGAVTVPPENAEGVGQLVANLLFDWADGAWSWELAQLGGQVVPFTLNYDIDKPGQARTYTGTLRVPKLAETWAVRQPQRADVKFVLVTVAYPPTRYVAPPAAQQLVEDELGGTEQPEQEVVPA